MPSPNPPSHLRDDMYKSLLTVPVKTFMYTIDQIAHMLDMTELALKKNALFYVGRERRMRTNDDMIVVNLARPNADPIWRISEKEFMRWMKHKRIRFRTSAQVNSDQ